MNWRKLSTPLRAEENSVFKTDPGGFLGPISPVDPRNPFSPVLKPPPPVSRPIHPGDPRKSILTGFKTAPGGLLGLLKPRSVHRQGTRLIRSCRACSASLVGHMMCPTDPKPAPLLRNAATRTLNRLQIKSSRFGRANPFDKFLHPCHISANPRRHPGNLPAADSRDETTHTVFQTPGADPQSCGTYTGPIGWASQPAQKPSGSF